ncbi:MAG: undecaprenyldiphospho-muramoylpentapeptide beta-N-acetylglucosaminyltransferase [Prevotellaceae bacterium]|jgi:UDP-N-acetylglucosamine--N-acetylmuramyl-(pentapeptide) pyrophosphoryl-undecaprenol N-acetylglucosamine transferase|nr:undecaprenyldiphospho-muramoylpentapeptide beta-N-acetylglucosaminyltransferase [Prevotellaceae bacterium]
MKNNPKFIISGGGTGGHIFPAISIANALKAKLPESEILFVGAEGRMEMERVPAAGYKIIGLPMMGLERKNMLKNFKVLYRSAKSLLKARKIIKEFKPDVAVGVGGYASGAVLQAANWAGVPTVLQEQNSYAGVTNKLLAKRAKKICVAYEGMERFFPKENIILTGNPVRQDLTAGLDKKAEAYEYFGFSPDKKTILVVGGSLGARTINQSILELMKNEEWRMKNQNIQIIWQTGKFYFGNIKNELKPVDKEQGEQFFTLNSSFLITEFVSRMDLAYAIADLVISRAGASSISELCLLKKPVILVPSPNVSEDHQTQNALALVRKDAAIMVKDAEAVEKLIPEALQLIADDKKLASLAENIEKLAQHDSANRIADEIIKLIK